MQVSSVKVILNKLMGMTVGAQSFRDGLSALTALIAILAPQLFFTISGLVGFNYGGADESLVYVRFIVAGFLLIFTAFILSLAFPQFSRHL